MKTFLLISSLIVCISLTAQNKPTMEVFPNPANEQVTLQFSETAKEHLQITIMDILGNTLHSFQFRPAAQIRIDLSGLGLQNGFYLIRAESDGHTCIRRLLIRQS